MQVGVDFFQVNFLLTTIWKLISNLTIKKGLPLLSRIPFFLKQWSNALPMLVCPGNVWLYYDRMFPFHLVHMSTGYMADVVELVYISWPYVYAGWAKRPRSEGTVVFTIDTYWKLNLDSGQYAISSNIYSIYLHGSWVLESLYVLKNQGDTEHATRFLKWFLDEF